MKTVLFGIALFIFGYITSEVINRDRVLLIINQLPRLVILNVTEFLER